MLGERRREVLAEVSRLVSMGSFPSVMLKGLIFTLVLGFSREKEHIHNPIHTMKIN